MLAFDESGWLYPNPSENIVHDIGISELNDLLQLAADEESWAAEVREIIERRMEKPEAATFNRHDWIFEEIMLKNTGGTIVSMPFGKDIITFNSNRHFFRGENQEYPRSTPSLLRKLEGKTAYEIELIKAVAVMRVYQFSKFIWQINVIPYWEAKLSDINYDALAQHYGFDTCLIDLTNDFKTALFFATCKYDYATDSYRPLTAKDIETSEKSKYGILFHSPNWVLDYLNGGGNSWLFEHMNDRRDMPYTFYSGELDGLAFQIGYQPLMRCHHQSGYIMPMMNAVPLQEDTRFEKLRFLQSEEISIQVFEMMDKGQKIFPHEGIRYALDVLRSIQHSSVFSEDDMSYAYEFGAADKMQFPTIDDFRKALSSFKVDGTCVTIQKNEVEYHLKSSVMDSINSAYDGRNLLDVVGNMIHQRPEHRRYREQRCIEIYGKLI